MEELKPGTPEHFFKGVTNFMEVNAPGKKYRVVTLIECETGEFWIQGMWENEIWVRGMIDMGRTIIDSKVQQTVWNNAEKTEERMREQELMATEVKGKAQ